MSKQDQKNPKEASNIFHSIMKASVSQNKISNIKVMTRDYEYKGNRYWVTVEPAINTETNQTVFLAYVNNQKPGGLLYGSLVRNPDGKPMVFANETSAFINANAVKQSEIG